MKAFVLKVLILIIVFFSIKIKKKFIIGFLQLSEFFPTDYIYQLIVEENKTVYLTGHSFGGLVADLCLYSALCKFNDPKWLQCMLNGKLMSLTFGAPFFGDIKLRDFINKKGWGDLFVHIISL